jgi:hypothetical protein
MPANDPGAYLGDDLGPLDMSTMLPELAPQEAQRTGVPADPRKDRRAWMKLLALLPAAMKGGPGALEGLLHGFQQSDLLRAQRQQQEAEQADREAQRQRQAMLDERAAQQQGFDRNFRLATFNRQQARQQEQDRRQLLGDIERSIAQVTTPAEVRALLELYRPRVAALGIPQGQFEAAVLERATPSALQVRQAREKLDEVVKTYGKDAPHFVITMPGEPAPIPFAELERRAGFQRSADAPPRGEASQGTRTEFEQFFDADFLPAKLEERRAAGNTKAPTRTEIRDWKIEARELWAGAGRAPERTATTTITEKRQQEARLDEEVAFLLRNPGQGTRQRWAQIVRAYESLGIPYIARRDSIARRVEREDRQAAGSDPLAEVFTAAERMQALDAAVRGEPVAPASAPAPFPGRGRGAGPGPSSPVGGVQVRTPDGQVFTFRDQAAADAFRQAAGL